MLQELCRSSFFKACKAVSDPRVKLKGAATPFLNFYEPYDNFIRYNWDRVPLGELSDGRRTSVRHMRRMAWIWFNDNADKLREHYFRVRWGRDIAKAMMESGTFEVLFEDFYSYFEEREDGFMDQVNKALDMKSTALEAMGRHPQSHGGVANLLKVLTKTMRDQGSSIYTIAKVQYAVCMQAGIYIPDEFLTDVLVAHEMIAEG